MIWNTCVVMVTEVSHFTILVLLYDMYCYCQRLYGRRGAEDNWVHVA